MGCINPLLNLTAARALLKLPPADREGIEAVMRDVRDQANADAENAWLRRKGPMAAYWRAVSAKPCTSPTPSIKARTDALKG